MKKVVITGGHTTPAIALIERIKKEGGWEIYFFGRKYALEGLKEESFEFKSVSSLAEVRFIPLNTGRLQRRFSRHTIPSLLRVVRGFFSSFIWLVRIKPDLIVSFGGYLSVPVVIAGWLLRIPSLTHVQTSALCLADRINLHFVKKIAVSFPELLKDLPSDKAVFTGNPLREEIFWKEPREKSELFDQLKTVEKPLLLITGGKTGSKIINSTVKKILPQLRKRFFVLHQVGLDRDIKPEKRRNYLSVRFIDNKDIGWILNRVHLIVSRAGANSVLDFAALEKPAVLIPIPWTAANEQGKNAAFLEGLGLAEVINQKALNPKLLLETVLAVSSNIDRYKIERPPSWWLRFNPRDSAGRLWLAAKEILKRDDEA